MQKTINPDLPEFCRGILYARRAWMLWRVMQKFNLKKPDTPAVRFFWAALSGGDPEDSVESLCIQLDENRLRFYLSRSVRP